MIEVGLTLIALILIFFLSYKQIFHLALISILIVSFMLITRHEGVSLSIIKYSFLLLVSGWVTYTLKPDEV